MNAGKAAAHGLEFAHRRDGWIGLLAVFTLALLGLFTFLVVDRLAHGGGSTVAAPLMLLLLVLAVVALPAPLLDHVQAQLRMFVRRRAPLATQQAAQRQFLRVGRVLALGGAAAAAAAVALAEPAPGEALRSAPVAALAVALCGLATWATLGAWRGWLHRSALLLPLAALCLVGAMGVRGVGAALLQWPAAATLGLLAFTLALTEGLLRRALWAQQLHPLSGSAPPQASPRTSPQTAWRQFQVRWLRSRPLYGPIWLLILVLNPAISLSQREGLMPAPFGEAVTPVDLLRVLIFFVVASAVLQASGLHWRHALSPAGGFRRRLGWNIVGATWLCVVGMLLLWLAFTWLLFLVLDGLAGGSPASPNFTALGVHAPVLLLELLLGCALAAALGATQPGRPIRTLLLAAAIGLNSTAAAAWLAGGWTQLDSLALWRMGWGHVLGLLLLSLCVSWLAARGWQRVDLALLLRFTQRRESDDEGGFPRQA